MTIPTPCPGNDALRALLDGTRPEQEQAAVSRHLEACAPCQERLESLVAGRDSWSGAVERLGTPEPPAGVALQRVIGELKRDGLAAHTETGAWGSAELPQGFLSPADKPGRLGRLKHHDVIEVIGRGGMAVVLRAFDTSLHRVVAIKVLAAHLASNASARQRFKREAQAAAGVSHDHVVTIHAVEEADGIPYIVMQYVAGMSLQEKIDRSGPLEVKEILRIGMQAAAGLAAAHAQGLVHRDVKPANILLENGIERVKLTDFGLARAADDASLTQSGVLAGTPQYMAPEQAGGEAVDHRADLFSLGSVLYAMCTGRPPFRASSTLAVLRRVREDSPRPVREINPDIPEWLAAIIDKLHEKEPDDRFSSAQEVAELLGQHLAHLQQPTALPPPPVAARAVRAHTPAKPSGLTWVLLAVAVAMLPCCLLPVGLTLAYLAVSYTSDDVQRSPAMVALEEHEDHVHDGVVTLRDNQVVERLDCSVPSLAFSPDRETLAAGTDKGSLNIYDVAKINLRGHVPVAHAGPVGCLAYSPDGSRLASGGWDGKVHLWAAPRPGMPVATLHGHREKVWSVAYSPDGKLIASAGADRTARVWKADRDEQVQSLEHPFPLYSVAFSPDGTLLATGDHAGTVRLWEVATWKPRKVLTRHEGPVRVAFSPTGQTLATGGHDRTVVLWDMPGGQPQVILSCREPVACVAFSGNGAYLATAGGDGKVKNRPGEVKVWDVAQGQEMFQMLGHSDVVLSVAFAPGGGRVATASRDHTVRLWELPVPR